MPWRVEPPGNTRPKEAMNTTTNTFIKYFRKGAAEGRDLSEGEGLEQLSAQGISVSEADAKVFGTVPPGKVFRNPANPFDQWYVAREFFAEHYWSDEPIGKGFAGIEDAFDVLVALLIQEKLPAVLAVQAESVGAEFSLTQTAFPEAPLSGQMAMAVDVLRAKSAKDVLKTLLMNGLAECIEQETAEGPAQSGATVAADQAG